MTDEPRFPIQAAQLLGVQFEVLFYGIYLTTCVFAARLLFCIGFGRHERWRKLDEIQWMITFFGLALFMVNTFDVVIGLYHNYKAFIQPPHPTGAQALLAGSSGWVDITRSIAQVIVIVLGEFILVYRCWIVYSRRWLVALPSLSLYLTSVATAIRFIQLRTESSPATEVLGVNASNCIFWWILFFAITAVQNILTTSLLIYRLRKLDPYEGDTYTTPEHPHIRRVRQLYKIAIIIAESGAFYTLLVFITFVLGAARSNGSGVAADISQQSAGIMLNAILLRCLDREDWRFTPREREELVFARNSELGSEAWEDKSARSAQAVQASLA